MRKIAVCFNAKKMINTNILDFFCGMDLRWCTQEEMRFLKSSNRLYDCVGETSQKRQKPGYVFGLDYLFGHFQP